MDKLSKPPTHKINPLKLGDTPALLFMNPEFVKLRPDYNVKSTIETFRTRHISGAPVVDYQDKIIGVVSEYDLLIQAASQQLLEPIKFQTKIISVTPEQTLKEILLLLYKQKLKWMPVVNKNQFIRGIITRIDVLHFIATHDLST